MIRNPAPEHLEPELPPAQEEEARRRERLARETRELDEALASAAAGRTVTLDAVKAWVDSWDTDHELPHPRSGN